MLHDSTTGRAQFDATGTYRYSLERQWANGCSRLAIIMLNPSRADHRLSDPTVRRCIALAQRWGFQQLEVVNLFAYRTPYPKALKQAPEPVGADNDIFLRRAAERAEQVLLAWGNGGIWLGRDRKVLSLLQAHRSKFCCLGHNRTGQPRHPLYVRRDIELLDWL